MNPPNEIEKSLQRLMPAALSDRAQKNISQMLVSLAESSSQESVSPVQGTETIALDQQKKWRFARTKMAAMAATIILSAVPAWILFAEKNHDSLASDTTKDIIFPQQTEPSAADPVLVERLSVMNHDDAARLVRNSDGSVVKEINRKIHTRERYRVGSSGDLITISTSREEKVRVPKSSF